MKTRVISRQSSDTRSRVATGFLSVIAVLLSFSTVGAQKSKELHLTAKAPEGHAIEILGFTGADIEFTTWDKPEVLVNLRVEFSSSDDEWEEDYIREVRLSEENSAGKVVVRFDQPNRDAGFSFKRLLSLDFSSYTKKRISGEVFVPKKNPLFSDLRYGKISLEGIEGALELDGQSNTVSLKNCADVRRVDNDYGTTTIEHSGGQLSTENKSGKTTIVHFTGRVDIDAQYSTVSVSNVSEGVTIVSQSGTVTVADVKGNLAVKAPYSRVSIGRVQGMVEVENKSGSLVVETVDGISIDAPYSNVEVSKVSGKAGESIRIKGQSGRIELLDAKGNVHIESPYTTIRLRNIDGNVDVGTTSGSVTADGVFGTWNSNTKYTRVDIRSLKSQSVTVENTSGTVDIQLASVPAQFVVNNSYADVNVELPKGLSATVRLKSEYGSIRSDLPLEIEKMSSSAIAIGSVGSGTGTFRVETKSGSIRVVEK